MTTILTNLVHQARTALGSVACKNGGHHWVSDGGRACPHDITDNCSQAVYTCYICGETDYGGPGGPGDADCDKFCKNRVERAIAVEARRVDPLGFAWASLNGNRKWNKTIHQRRLAALRRQPKPRLP
jgi:hypothetical protein